MAIKSHNQEGASVPLKINPNYRRRKLLLISSYFLLVIVTVFIPVNVFVTQMYTLAFLEAVVFFYILFLLLFYYKSYNLDTAITHFTLLIFFVGIGFMLASNKQNNSFGWLYLFPISVFFLWGTKKGIYIVGSYTLIFFSYLLYATSSIISGISVVNIMVSYVIVSGTIFYYEYSREEVFNELEKVLEREKVLSVTDTITKLYNRGKIEFILTTEFQLAHRYNELFSIVMIDIDHFKEVNDRFGHQVGDVVLFEVAQIIQSTIRKTDYIGRWGGEEFMLVLPKTTLEDATTIAQGLCKRAASNSFTDAGRVTLSFGVATFGVFDTLNALIKRADECLYIAKEQGRNQVVDQRVFQSL